MIIVLRIASILITTAGAVVALWGEPRRNTRLTPQGWLAVILIALGLLVSSSVEVVQWRADQIASKRRELDALIDSKWEAAGDQAMDSISVEYYHRREIPVGNFLRHIGRIQFRISIAPAPDTGEYLTRLLQVVRRADALDFEQSFALVAKEPSGVILGSGGSVKIAQRGVPPSLTSQPEARLPESRAPNDASERNPSFIAVIADGPTTLVTGGWAYTIQPGHRWTTSNLKASGINADIQWKELVLPSTLQRLHDLRRMSFEITVPYGYDLRVVDIFQIRFVTTGLTSVGLDLKGVKYSRGEQGWVYSLSGPDLYIMLTSNYRSQENYRWGFMEESDG